MDSFDAELPTSPIGFERFWLSLTLQSRKRVLNTRGPRLASALAWRIHGLSGAFPF